MGLDASRVHRQQPMRVVFMGTPAFAVPTLEALHEAGHEILSVITQPDRPAGRGKKLKPSPVKEKALELGLPVFQPERVKRDEGFDHISTHAPDVVVVVGYGQIIPQRIIDLPKFGCVNVHSSLLPKYRGAAPMNWAIVNGESVTGVCTMQLVFKLDAGDVLLSSETPIGPNETTPELAERLAPMGADLAVATLEGLAAGTITPQPQDEEEVTYAPIIKREDGLVDWTRSAVEIHNRVRGFDPWPGAYTFWRGGRFQVRRARPAEGVGQPGQIAIEGDRLFIGCGEGRLEALEVQPEGKKRMSDGDFVRGYRPENGEAFSNE